MKTELTQTEIGSRTLTQSVVLVGIGGQGILLASEIVAKAAMQAGYQVKTNEVHGMAQCGGSVVVTAPWFLKARGPRVLGALEQDRGAPLCRLPRS